MTGGRATVQLDAERRRRLNVVAENRGVSVAEALSTLIDRAYDEQHTEERVRAAVEIGSMLIEDVADPDELSKQLSTAHSLPDLY